jgi:hypothetical protein
MRTTVVLDDRLVEEARKVLGGESLRSMIETSLREAIKLRQREALRQAIGAMDLAITEEDLAHMRRDRQEATEAESDAA